MKTVMLSAVVLFNALHLTAQPKNSKMKPVDIFKNYITGDFDNSSQVTAEIKMGKQIHPLAVHVNRVANHKIKNIPDSILKKGFFIIEESYYLTEGKPLEIKPYLFLFTAGKNATVQLAVFQIPEGIKKEELRNDNKNLFMDYNLLKPSPTFKGATYSWDEKQKTFSTNAPNDLPNGIRFTLIETFTKDKLEVMELLEKDGRRLTPYDTPLIYIRKKLK
jgi:hypothetical protein